VNSESQHWGTPRKYVDSVKQVFGGVVGLDPCSNPFSVVGAEHAYALPENDGLEESWDASTIYVNPPYGSDRSRGTTIRHWLAKCAEAHELFGAEVIALVPVAPNTRHWKDSIFGKAEAVCFLYDTRLKFLESGRSGGKGAPMACAMVYWGRHREKFAIVFDEHGATVNLSDLKCRNLGAHGMLAI